MEFVSDKITQRIIESGESYFANSNISQFIEPGELDLLEDEVADRIQLVLEGLIIDTDLDHNTNETAKRMAKMYIREIFKGRYCPPPKITAFPNLGYKSLYTTGPISIRSTCAHHFQNIIGRCWVGVIPNGEVIGLSKFNRLIHHIAESPQIQEEMTT